VDLIVSDIPYRVISGGNTTKHRRCTGMLSANDGKIFDHNDTHFTEYMDDLYRVLKPVAHCYLFTNLLNLWDLQTEMVRAGFKIHNLLIWHKDNTTPNRWYMKNAEYVIMARKGPARTIYTPGKSVVQQVKNVRGKMHPTEKPVDLLKTYIEASSKPGELVLDPFCGSGSTGEAALSLGRRFVGVEIDKKYADIARNRINEVQNDNTIG